MKRKAKYGYLWVTLVLFGVSLLGHWGAGWLEYKEEQKERGLPTQISSYVIKMTVATLENWQSEFLQLIWQVAGLSFLWYVGSPQSKEGEERLEHKLDAILRAVEPEKAGAIMRELEAEFPKE